MKRLILATFVAFVTFAILNFLYSNLGGEAFNHPLSFQFGIPRLFTLYSNPIPVGFVVITAFCLGMIFLPFLQLIPWLFRSREIRLKQKRIRELEEQLESTRQVPPFSTTPDAESASSS